MGNTKGAFETKQKKEVEKEKEREKKRSEPIDARPV